jgi:Zn-dependent membrane protease YugP
MFFDPMYFVFLAPGILLALWAQWRVHSAYEAASRIRSRANVTGAEAADQMLAAAGVEGVRIEPVEGFLSDHYVPGQGVLRLSPGVFQSRSLAALGIACHEAGHAIQDARRYPLLVARNALVPLAAVGGNLSWIIILAGFVLGWFGLILTGIAVFSLTVFFQLVNLPVEFDASRRARVALVDSGTITADEAPVVARVLNAAAWTYVAATVSSILVLLYYLFRAGVFSSRD